MATQQGTSPISKAGTLLNNDWSDYNTPQEYFDAIAERLEISVDGGATGAQGETGATGGDQDTKYEMTLVKQISLTVGVKSVNTAIDLTDAIIQITAPAGHSTLITETFGVGVVENQTVHFLFNSDEANQIGVARTGWIMKIWQLNEI